MKKGIILGRQVSFLLFLISKKVPFLNKKRPLIYAKINFKLKQKGCFLKLKDIIFDLKRYLFREKKGIILNEKRYHFGTIGIIFPDFDFKKVPFLNKKRPFCQKLNEKRYV